jgi:geranial dehydrogenase
MPWNYPVVLAMSKIGPALAAGCSIVVKPAPNTVLDSYILAEAALEAKLPPGVINWVPAERAAGAYLVSHPGVDKVAFTGSTAAGRAIGKVCGEMLRPVSLELGGKSAAIILGDADLDAIFGRLQFISLMNNGQILRRLRPHPSRRKAATRKWWTRWRRRCRRSRSAIRCNARPRSGRWPPAHREKVEGYIAKGKDRGQAVRRWRAPEGHRPRLVRAADGVRRRAELGHHRAGRDLRPGAGGDPVLDEADVRCASANDSIYGLGGAVFSADTERAEEHRAPRADRTIGSTATPSRSARRSAASGQWHRTRVRAGGHERLSAAEVDLRGARELPTARIHLWQSLQLNTTRDPACS